LEKIFTLVKVHCDYLQNRYKEFHGIRTGHRRKKVSCNLKSASDTSLKSDQI